jgi:hypothetical protein
MRGRFQRSIDAINHFEQGRPAQLARFLRSDWEFSAEAREFLADVVERVQIKPSTSPKRGRPLSEHYHNPVLRDDMRALYQILLKRHQARPRVKGEQSPRQCALVDVAGRYHRSHRLRIDVETVRKVVALPKRKKERKPA